MEKRMDEIEALRAEVGQLRAERDEARAWARGYEHRLFLFDTDNPPEWLTAPVALPDGS